MLNQHLIDILNSDTVWAFVGSGGEGDVHKIIKLKTFPLSFTKLMGPPLFV